MLLRLLTLHVNDLDLNVINFWWRAFCDESMVWVVWDEGVLLSWFSHWMAPYLCRILCLNRLIITDDMWAICSLGSVSVLLWVIWLALYVDILRIPAYLLPKFWGKIHPLLCHWAVIDASGAKAKHRLTETLGCGPVIVSRILGVLARSHQILSDLRHGYFTIERHSFSLV